MDRKDPTRIFLWMVYLFLVAIWVAALLSGAAGTGWRLAVFTLLLIAHGVLHGSLPHLIAPPWRVAAYATVQSALAIALAVLSHGFAMALALFFPIAGELLGLFTTLTGRLIGLGGVVAAWAVTVLATGGWSAFRAQGIVAAGSFLFVAVYVILFTKQMQERERAEGLLAQLETVNGQLRAYALRVEELSISLERQRMARELHDTLAQGLAGLIMQLETVDELLGRGEGEKARGIVNRAGQRARTALADARAVIQALRAPQEEGNPLEAIARQVEQFRADTGINCVLEVGPGEIRLEGDVGRQVLRLVQEGLANVARHARAGQAAVRLSVTDGAVRLAISDAGAGFDPAEAAARPGHFGLMGLQERTRLAGGTLTIQSAPGKGTRLEAVFPGKEE
jgi:two-component system, NarL family, sensor histidine kinase YdfH